MRGGCNLTRKNSSGDARSSSRMQSGSSQIERTSTAKQTRSTTIGKRTRSSSTHTQVQTENPESPETEHGSRPSGSPLGENPSADSRTRVSGSRHPSPPSHSENMVSLETPETNEVDEGTNQTITQEAENQTRRVRGLTQGVSRPATEDERLKVTVFKNTLMQAKARDKIQPIMRKFYKTFYKTWEAWPKLEKDALWDQFLIYFRFESPQQEALGRQAWNDFTDQNYPKWLFRWKETALKKHGSLEVAKENPPEWANDKAWADLCTYWMSEEFKEASDLRKRNRAAGVVIPHTSGPKPYVVLRVEKSKEIGRPLTQYDEFLLTHTQKVKGTNEKRIVSKEAEQILDNYGIKLREKFGDSDVPFNEFKDEGLEVYKEVVGGVKKGHLLGRPREKWSARKKARCPPQYEEHESSIEVMKLRGELAQRDMVIAGLTDTLTMVCQKLGIPQPSNANLGNAPPSNHDASDMASHEEEDDEDDTDETVWDV